MLSPVLFWLLLCGSLCAAKPVAPEPTHADVRYGAHERNVLDFWAAPGASAAHPAPLVVYIHGGGFSKGDKSKARESKLVGECLRAGVSFAAINYRFRDTTSLPEILRDCARAVQFLRAQADAWHIDRTRVAAYGSSAGAGTSLWLAFHPDLADPQSEDPVLRESTRLTCAAALSTQCSYDFVRWRDLFPEEVYRRVARSYLKPAFYGLKTQEELDGAAGAAVRADCDMLGLMTKDAPPFFLGNTLPDLAMNTSSQVLHHPSHSQRLYERAKELGVPVVANVPAVGLSPPRGGPKTLRDFLLLHLRATAPASRL